MSVLLCKLWPYLLGGLIGWLLAGLFARRLKFVEPPVERIVEKEVEKIVDNPEHLSLISSLKSENSELEQLRSRIAELEATEPEIVEEIVEKEVEKIVEVDNPKLLTRIEELEVENAQIAKMHSRIAELEAREPDVVEKEVEKIVEIDSPALLERIDQLEAENKQLDDLHAKISALEAQEPEVVIKEVEKIVEKEVDNPVHVQRIGELEEKVGVLQATPEIDLQAAHVAGIKIDSENDLTAIEGIGPKTNELIQANGIQSFAALADTEAPKLQQILDSGGSSYKSKNPDTWPDQANLAASNRWSALKALQDILVGGVYPDTNVNDQTHDGTTEHAAAIETESIGSTTEADETNLDEIAAKAAGFTLKSTNGYVDFTIIEGIGPKTSELIHAAGIHTFKALSRTYVEDLQKILDKGGSAFSMAKPGTWPAQADLAASNQWELLKAWQDELDAGE